jgi:hypothetical protein
MKKSKKRRRISALFLKIQSAAKEEDTLPTIQRKAVLTIAWLFLHELEAFTGWSASRPTELNFTETALRVPPMREQGSSSRTRCVHGSSSQ